MKQINVDTVKIRECGKDIMELSIELNEIINTMFNRINNMSNASGEWIGTSANDFIQLAKIDRIQYLNMKDSIYTSGKYLVDYANTMERVINEVKE